MNYWGKEQNDVGVDVKNPEFTNKFLLGNVS